MFFHRVGNNWIIELKYNYKFQDLLDYNYDIYKELLENDDLYKAVISKFCLDEPFLVNVLENKDDTLLLFTINKKDLEDKLVIKDDKNKQRYLALIGKSKREEFDLCLLYDDKNEEIKISQVIDYLRQPDLAQKISMNNGYILGVSIVKLYKALEEKGFLDDNNRLEMASSVEIDSLKESYLHLKKILTITKKEKVKKRLAVLRKKINKKLGKTLDSEINESNREYHNFLMYKDLKREDISLIKSNLEILRRACLYYIPIVDNVYLDKVLKEYDADTIEGYSLEEIWKGIDKNLSKYLKDNTLEKIIIDKIYKHYQEQELFKNFLTTNNNLMERAKRDIKSDFAERVLAQMPTNYDSYAQAYYLYKMVAQTFVYDSEFYAANQSHRLLKQNHLSFNDISCKDEKNNRIVCYDSSVLLAYLLERIGYYTKVVSEGTGIIDKKVTGHCHVLAWNGKYFLELDLTSNRVFDLYKQKTDNTVESFNLVFSRYKKDFTEEQLAVDKYFEEKYDTFKEYKKKLEALKDVYGKQEIDFEKRLEGFVDYFKENIDDDYFGLATWQDIRNIIFAKEARGCDVTYFGYKVNDKYKLMRVITFNEYGIDYTYGRRNNYLLLKDNQEIYDIDYDELKHLTTLPQFRLLGKDIPGIIERQIVRKIK